MFSVRSLVLLSLACVLALPFLVRSRVEGRRATVSRPDPDAKTLIIVTPHVEQIRDEFAAGFDRWHRRVHGSGVRIDWRAPGGTTEIIKLLQSQFTAAANRFLEQTRRDNPAALLDPAFTLDAGFTTGAIPVDLVFGGGSFDHGRLKDPRNVAVLFTPTDKPGPTTVKVLLAAPIDFDRLATLESVTLDARLDGQAAPLRLQVPRSATGGSLRALLPLQADPKTPIDLAIELAKTQRVFQVAMSTPVGFTQAQLDQWLGENKIGSEQLYDPQQHWIGAALSGFGIVYNTETLAELGRPIPQSFAELGHPVFIGKLGLADPRQSGSVATAYDSILNKEGWDKGWSILREMAANARYFSSSSTQPPMDVSQGEAAAGVAIDFYGRGQAQSLEVLGSLGSAAHAARVGYIDPPGATYIDADPASIVRGGPQPELARRFIEFYLSHEGQALWQFPPRSSARGQTNPKVEGSPDLMGPVQYRLRRMPIRRDMYSLYRDSLADQTNPFDIASDTKRRNWRDGMIVMMGCMGIDTSAELRAAWAALIAARGDTSFPADRLAEMESIFYSMPKHELRGKDGSVQSLPFSEEHYKAISDDTARWRDPIKGPRSKIAYSEFFRAQYQRVVELASQR